MNLGMSDAGCRRAMAAVGYARSVWAEVDAAALAVRSIVSGDGERAKRERSSYTTSEMARSRKRREGGQKVMCD